MGIPCFLDDKEIKIGDSIHRVIIEGIERSTHLIHVISKHSINSRWVREELEIAHVKSMEGDGYKILPLLIDEIELPATIKHIKVGDFRWWRTQERYYSALDSLLDALDFKNPITLDLEAKVFVMW